MAIKEYRDGRERRTAAMLPEVFDQVRKIAHYGLFTDECGVVG